MKKLAAFLLILTLLVPAAALGEGCIINKIREPENDFAFPEGAKLLEVYFPPIYGCDAALVKYGDDAMLIDCAGNQWRTVAKMLDTLGITELTYAVNSHPDADHIGGFNHVLEKVPAKEFVLGFPEDYPSGDQLRFKIYADLHEQNVPFHRVENGEVLPFGDVQVTVHQRTDEALPRVNNKSVMLMVQLGQRRIFFTGDIQRDAQLLLAADADQLDLKADILKFPHHGYKPMQAGFLDMVDPEMVVITSGRNSAEGAQQLWERKIPFYFCENGILRLLTDGETWVVDRIPD